MFPRNCEYFKSCARDWITLFNVESNFSIVIPFYDFIKEQTLFVKDKVKMTAHANWHVKGFLLCDILVLFCSILRNIYRKQWN